MDTRSEVLELLRCALANCDNIPRLGIAGIEVVKFQIKEAIDLIEAGSQKKEAQVDGNPV